MLKESKKAFNRILRLSVLFIIMTKYLFNPVFDLFNPVTEVFIQSNHLNFYSIRQSLKYLCNPITEIFIQSMFNPFMVIYCNPFENTFNPPGISFNLPGEERQTQIHSGHQNPLQADWTHFSSCHPPRPAPGGGVKRVFIKGEALSLRRSATESGSRKNQNIPIFFWLRLRLRWFKISWNHIVRVRSGSGSINQSQCSFTRFVIGLVIPLLLLLAVCPYKSVEAGFAGFSVAVFISTGH